MIDTEYEVHPEIAAARSPEVPVEPEQPSVYANATPDRKIEVVETKPEPSDYAKATPDRQHESKQETPQQISFRQIREAKEKAERERDDLLRLIQQQQPKQQQLPEEDDDLGIGTNDLAEGKHLVKMQTKMRKLESQLKSYQQQSSATIAEAKLKAAYPDFDKVVSPDNIASLKAAYPELANTLNSGSDLYSTAVSAYTLIKKFGIYQEDPYKADIERVQQNASKPKPSLTVSPQQGSDGALSRANAFASGLTDELKAQLRKEMNTARQNM